MTSLHTIRNVDGKANTSFIIIIIIIKYFTDFVCLFALNKRL